MSRRVPETLRPSDPNARVPITLSLRWVTVEPSVFFVAFAMGMTLVANADLYVEKTCLEVLALLFLATMFFFGGGAQIFSWPSWLLLRVLSCSATGRRTRRGCATTSWRTSSGTKRDTSSTRY